MIISSEGGRIMNNIKNKEPLFAALGLYILAFILQMPSFIRSGYIRIISKDFLTCALLLALFIIFVWRIFNSASGVYLTAASAVLLLANWSQPMLYYSCALNDDVPYIASKVKLFTIIVIAVTMAIWIAMGFIEKLWEHQWIMSALGIIISLGICAVVFLFSDSESNTSTVFNIQPALIMLFIILYCFSVFLQKHLLFGLRIAHLFCFWAMIAILIYRHEMGIPLIAYGSCIIMYLLFYPLPKFGELLILIAVPIIGAIMLVIQSPALLNDTIEKITQRFGENEHAFRVVIKLQNAGLFGSTNYIYLPEASSDFAINTNISTFGYIWFIVFVVLLFLGCRKKGHELSSPSGYYLSKNLQSLSFVTFCVIIVYNIGVNMASVAIMGVQSLFCGISYSIAVLSGAILGSIIYDQKSLEKTADTIVRFCTENDNRAY